MHTKPLQRTTLQHAQNSSSSGAASAVRTNQTPDNNLMICIPVPNVRTGLKRLLALPDIRMLQRLRRKPTKQDTMSHCVNTAGYTLAQSKPRCAACGTVPHLTCCMALENAALHMKPCIDSRTPACKAAHASKPGSTALPHCGTCQPEPFVPNMCTTQPLKPTSYLKPYVSHPLILTTPHTFVICMHMATPVVAYSSRTTHFLAGASSGGLRVKILSKQCQPDS
jgi:hypothetical protein